MTYGEKIKVWFREAVNESNITGELRHKILSDPNRTKGFTDKLTREITLAVYGATSKIGRAPKQDNIRDIAKSLTIQWAENIEREAQRRFESDLERIRKEEEQRKKDDIEKTASGIVSGEFTEYVKDGLIIDDKIIGARQ